MRPKRAFIIGRRFQIVHVMFGQDLLEVTTFRGNGSDNAPKDEHGRVLRDNSFGPQHEDAARRDFTVDWVHLKLNDQAQRTVLCKDPFKSVDERVEKLISSM